jgi:hypothetical protein
MEHHPSLREISLRGNPIQINTDPSNYSVEVLNRFPALKVHDSVQVKQIKFNIPTEKIVLPPPKGKNFQHLLFRKFFGARKSKIGVSLP